MELINLAIITCGLVMVIKPQLFFTTSGSPVTDAASVRRYRMIGWLLVVSGSGLLAANLIHRFAGNV
ncbi:MAG: hypothetical protein ACFCD0_23865 [Gemmataceae bacterium]